MQNYFNQAPCLFYTSADDGTLLQVNDCLCQILGYQAEELVNKKIESLFTVATKIFYQTHFYPLLKMQGHAEEIFITLKKSNGEEVPVLINAKREIADGRHVNLHAGMIVHHRQQFEEQLIAAKKAAEKALEENTELTEAKLLLQKHSAELDRRITVVNKQNEELKQFNHVVTHDLQEPLRKLSLFSGMLLEEEEIMEPAKLVGKIRNVTDQMRTILSGLQQYIWLTEIPLKRQTIFLEPLLAKVKHQLKQDFPNIDLVITKEGTDQLVADDDQLQLLFYHLLSNAIRFSKGGKEVSAGVSAEQIQLNQFRHVEGRYQYVDFIRLQIQDDGKGFDSMYTTQVFDLFRRLHAESGQGIGLALCKKIAENHHGTIFIKSKTDEGTVVTVYLPFFPAELSNNTKPATTTMEATLKSP